MPVHTWLEIEDSEPVEHTPINASAAQARKCGLRKRSEEKRVARRERLKAGGLDQKASLRVGEDRTVWKEVERTRQTEESERRRWRKQDRQKRVKGGGENKTVWKGVGLKVRRVGAGRRSSAWSPLFACARTATRLPMVPDGTNTASSFPSSAANWRRTHQRMRDVRDDRDAEADGRRECSGHVGENTSSPSLEAH
eukprot:1369327-Rhodomonas_salina.2